MTEVKPYDPVSEKVVSVDFGKERREVEGLMCRLLGIVEKQRQELIKDPVKFYRRAVDEIVALQEFVREIEEASFIPIAPFDVDYDVPPPLSRPMMVMPEDYERMKRVLSRIDRGVNRYKAKPKA